MKQKIIKKEDYIFYPFSTASLVPNKTRKVGSLKIIKTQDGTICVKVSQKTSIHFQINNNSCLKERPVILVDSDNRIITEDMNYIDLEKKQCNMTTKIVYLNANNLPCLEQIRIIINSENVKIGIRQWKNLIDSIPESFKFLNKEIEILQNGANISLETNHHGEWIAVNLQEKGYSATMQDGEILVSATKDFSDFEKILKKNDIEKYFIDSGKILVHCDNKNNNQSSSQSHFSWPKYPNREKHHKTNTVNFNRKATSH